MPYEPAPSLILFGDFGLMLMHGTSASPFSSWISRNSYPGYCTRTRTPELFAFTTWSIWTQRNQVRSARTGCSVDQIAQVYPRIGLRSLTQSSFPNNLAHHSLKFHGSLHLRIVSRLISIEHSSQAVHLNLALRLGLIKLFWRVTRW